MKIALLSVSFYKGSLNCLSIVCLCAVFLLHFTADTPASEMVYPEEAARDSLSAELQRAYKADTSDPVALLAYAKSVSDAAICRSLYKKVSAEKNAPDSIRAEAYYRLACMAYMTSNYTKAGSYCASAIKLCDSCTYSQLSLRWVMRDKKDSAAKTATAVVADSLFPKVKQCVSSDSVKKNADGKYFLQVGAFTAIENAHGLKQELSRRFPQVSVSAGNSNGKNVFRVRVGGFTNRETAKAFGDSALAPKKIPFRIIEE